jgi:cytochrome c oxidase assembly protein subunit 15
VPRWAWWVFVANLVGQIAIIVTGGVVRLTGSGLGCPTWPQCTQGSFVPTAAQNVGFHKFIEFGNRTLTFVLGVLALAAVYAAWRHLRDSRAAGRTPRTTLVWLAAIPLVGTAGQGVLGGITVLTGLSPLIVGAHLLVSMAIVAGCVVLVVRAGEPGDHPVVQVVRQELVWAAWLALALAGLVVVLGVLVTGSGPHAGDVDVPRLGLDPRTMSWVHADTVMLYLGVLLAAWLGARLSDAPSRYRRVVVVALVVALAQGVVGYTQYFTGLPWVVVAVHLLGASLVWAATVRIPLSTRTRGVTAA